MMSYSKSLSGIALSMAQTINSSNKSQAEKEMMRQKMLKGLTDDEITECFKITPNQYLPWQIYRRIGAKLRSKNENR